MDLSVKKDADSMDEDSAAETVGGGPVEAKHLPTDPSASAQKMDVPHTSLKSLGVNDNSFGLSISANSVPQNINPMLALQNISGNSICSPESTSVKLDSVPLNFISKPNSTQQKIIVNPITALQNMFSSTASLPQDMGNSNLMPQNISRKPILVPQKIDDGLAAPNNFGSPSTDLSKIPNFIGNSNLIQNIAGITNSVPRNIGYDSKAKNNSLTPDIIGRNVSVHHNSVAESCADSNSAKNVKDPNSAVLNNVGPSNINSSTILQNNVDLNSIAQNYLIANMLAHTAGFNPNSVPQNTGLNPSLLGLNNLANPNASGNNIIPNTVDQNNFFSTMMQSMLLSLNQASQSNSPTPTSFDPNDSSIPNPEELRKFLISKIFQQGNVTKEERKPFACHICDYKSKSRAIVNNHIAAVHFNERPFHCVMCGHKFGQKSQLKAHILAVHLQDRPHVCSICDSKFTTRSNLMKHIAAVHEKKKMFQCSQCDFSASRKIYINTHSLKYHGGLIENNIKLFSCTECDYTSCYKHNITTHMSTVHQGNKPFPCPHCDYRATQKSSLKTHMQRHQPRDQVKTRKIKSKKSDTDSMKNKEKDNTMETQDDNIKNEEEQSTSNSTVNEVSNTTLDCRDESNNVLAHDKSAGFENPGSSKNLDFRDAHKHAVNETNSQPCETAHNVTHMAMMGDFQNSNLNVNEKAGDNVNYVVDMNDFLDVKMEDNINYEESQGS